MLGKVEDNWSDPIYWANLAAFLLSILALVGVIDSEIMVKIRSFARKFAENL